MRMFALAVAAVALCGVAAADDAVELKRPALKAGDKVKVTKTEKNKTTQTFEAGGKKSAKKDEEDSRLVVYTEEVLTPGTGREKPVKSVRVYEAFEVKGSKQVPQPPLNAPITISKRDGKYSFACEKPLGDFAQKLDDEFNKLDEPTTDDFFPGKPVKPGESWKIDTAKFVKSLSKEKLTVDAAKATMTGKLVKVYKKDGKSFGSLELAMDFPIKDLGKDAPPIKRGVITAVVMGDVCIDGTDPTESTTSRLGFDVVVEADGVTVTVKADGALTSTKQLLPRK